MLKECTAQVLQPSGSERLGWRRLRIGILFLSRFVSQADYYTETPEYCQVEDGGSGVNPDTEEHLVLCTLLAVEYPRRCYT